MLERHENARDNILWLLDFLVPCGTLQNKTKFLTMAVLDSHAKRCMWQTNDIADGGSEISGAK